MLSLFHVRVRRQRLHMFVSLPAQSNIHNSPAQDPGYLVFRSSSSERVRTTNAAFDVPVNSAPALEPASLASMCASGLCRSLRIRFAPSGLHRPMLTSALVTARRAYTWLRSRCMESSTSTYAFAQHVELCWGPRRQRPPFIRLWSSHSHLRVMYAYHALRTTRYGALVDDRAPRRLATLLLQTEATKRRAPPRTPRMLHATQPIILDALGVPPLPNSEFRRAPTHAPARIILGGSPSAPPPPPPCPFHALRARLHASLTLSPDARQPLGPPADAES
ncbi:hypothetical protein BV25DRAFT_144490 [Artomyces pyxidatus]|uniref:Uncharacterized protein n=1 Tax=Artomyces pyxidatus TaxID=48021 RepID=A0ACB8TA66_9AGAM|nr:hypothetical protein BV25DRAFT_144490 [Artomyces pyxidatus]